MKLTDERSNQGEITLVSYTKGSADSPESVSFNILHSDKTIVTRVLSVERLMTTGYKNYTSGEQLCFLTDEQAKVICSFIRCERDKIKFEIAPKSIEEWRNLGIPLEDYLRLGEEINFSWFSLNLYRYKNNSLQLAAPYHSPADRQALNVTGYHTFALEKGVFVYKGVCERGCVQNLVPQITIHQVSLMDEAKKKVVREGEINGKTITFYVIADLSTWAKNLIAKRCLERFSDIDAAIAKFKGYRACASDYSDGYAKLTMGVSTSAGELDILHVRHNKNQLVTDFTINKDFEKNEEFLAALNYIHSAIGFDEVRVYPDNTKPVVTIPFSDWENPYFTLQS